MPQIMSSRTSSDTVVRLDDGRRAGVAFYGDHDGEPVLLLHGTPASRITYSFLDRTAAELGICGIAPDRPGIGLSDDLPNRGILDYPDDVIQIADALGVERFAVLGWSGGSAYALATAVCHPDRVRSVALVSGLAPLDGQEGTATGATAGLGRTERCALAITHNAPSAADRARITEPEARKLTAFFLEACRQGARGIVLDFRLLSFPWGFALDQVEVPVHVFHGSDDRTIPVDHAQVFVTGIGDAGLTIWEHEGHLAVWQHADEVLKALR